MAAWACRATREKEIATKPENKNARPWWYPLTPLLVLWIIYWGTAVTSSLNIGHRHILPTYPPLFILAGAAGLWFRRWPSAPNVISTTGEAPAVDSTEAASVSSGPAPRTILAARLIVLAAVAAAAATALGSWPNYLAYFNVLSGGPDRAYRRLVDSSLDWGQDLKGLREWLDAHPDETTDPSRVYLSYFGMADPLYYGIDVQPLPSFRTRWHNDVPPPPLTAGLYTVSATMLQPIYGNYPGHWNAVYEQQYQTLRGRFRDGRARRRRPGRLRPPGAAPQSARAEADFAQLRGNARLRGCAASCASASRTRRSAILSLSIGSPMRIWPAPSPDHRASCSPSPRTSPNRPR